MQTSSKENSPVKLIPMKPTLKKPALKKPALIAPLALAATLLAANAVAADMPDVDIAYTKFRGASHGGDHSRLRVSTRCQMTAWCFVAGPIT